MVAKVVALVNQKGGVGKTTSTVNLAAALVALQQNVLLVDLDPQGNASMGSGADKHALKYSVNDLLQQQITIKEAIIPNTPAGFDLLPSNSDLTQAEVSLLRVANKQEVLKSALQTIINDYDYILIDCPPSLSMLTVNALVAANSVIIPMQCEYYAMEGLSELLRTVKQIQASVNKDLSIEGILRTMFDNRNCLTKEVSEQLCEHFGDKVYKTVIPRNVRLAEAPSHSLPVLIYDRASKGAISYLALAQEFLQKQTSFVAKENATEQEEMELTA